MTAIHIPPLPVPPPSLVTASFAGLLEVTGPDNAGIMQKRVRVPRPARANGAWVSGVDGLGGEAAGPTVIRISERPWDCQEEEAGFELTLAAGQSSAQATGETEIPEDGWLFIFIVQAGGGHWGAQIGIEIAWR